MDNALAKIEARLAQARKELFDASECWLHSEGDDRREVIRLDGVIGGLRFAIRAIKGEE